jgi:DNA-binding FadR family transcriptional regulator
MRGGSADTAMLQPAGARLADRIAQGVVASRAPPGSIVASEAELMARHGAGRPVLRQAVRILEERGIARMRRGHGGGLVVDEPSADFAGRSLSIVIESLTDDLRPLSLLPMAVDTHLFLRGAPRLSVETCDRLRRLVRRLDRLSSDEFLRIGAHRQLHRAIRTASGEPAVALAHSAATEYAIDVIPYSVNVMAEASKGETWRITHDTAMALIAGDVAAMFDCRRRMIEMMQASRPDWAAIERDRRLAPKLTDVNRPEFQLAGHRAERLAREILREIRLMGWQAGARIGRGGELIERYGASASILRQAVRMLQEHSAVEVERGRRGGLFVAIPNRAMAVSRARAFLDLSGAAPADVEAFLVNLTLEELQSDHPLPGSALRSEIGAHAHVTLSALLGAIAAVSKSEPLKLFAEIFQGYLASFPAPQVPASAVVAAISAGDRVQSRRAILAFAAEASRPSA